MKDIEKSSKVCCEGVGRLREGIEKREGINCIYFYIFWFQKYIVIYLNIK